MNKLLIITAIFTIVLAPAEAATLRVPGDHARIQDAIDAAADGDTVLIGPGTYVETLAMDGKGGLTIIGEEGAEATIVDADRKGHGLRIQDCTGLTTVLGITLQRGLVDDSGGGLIAIRSNVAISWCRFLDNEALNEGGAVAFSNCTDYSLENCALERNRSEASAALNVVGGIGTVRANTILSNEGGLTVGLQFTGCRFEDNVVAHNTATGFGPFGYLFPIAGTVIGNTIAHNKGATGKGALLVQSGQCVVERNIVSNNVDLFGLQIDTNDGLVRVGHNDVWENDAGMYTAISHVETDFSEDPLFCDPKRGDFRLGSKSPCLPNEQRDLVGALGKGCE